MQQMTFQRKQVRLFNLIDGLDEGDYVIPSYREGEAWSDEKRIDRLNRVKDGLPIQEITVWRTSDHHVTGDGSIGPYGQESGDVNNYVIDGIRSCVTLYLALSDDKDWTVYFDLKECIFRTDSPILDIESDPRYMNLACLFETKAILDHQRDIRHTYDQDRLVETMVDRAEHLSCLFKEYQTSIVTIVSEGRELIEPHFESVKLLT